MMPPLMPPDACAYIRFISCQMRLYGVQPMQLINAKAPGSGGIIYKCLHSSLLGGNEYRPMRLQMNIYGIYFLQLHTTQENCDSYKKYMAGSDCFNKE